MLLITPTSNCFSLEQWDNGVQDNADEISNKEVWSRSLFAGSDKNQPIPYMPRKNQTFKKIPVKETTCIKISQHVNGKTTINDFVKEQKISQGSYGKVVLYRNKNDGTPYAIKPGSRTMALQYGVGINPFRLSMLKSLDVSFNSIVAIPEEIGSATSLVKFDCSSNHIKELPSSLGKCSGLSDLKGNKLTALSENLFASWKMLIELNASKNLLSGMPENIGCLSHLIRLDLHQNRILSIAPSITGCCSLVEFYMGNNALSMLPEEVGALSRLGTLDLHSNQLKEYPVGACKLCLSVLDLSNNSLTGLPAELGKLFIVDSEAKTPAKEVVTMAARLSLTSKELSLEGMVLSAVPSEVWESGEIIKVNLSRNSIQELPVELSSCVSLQGLKSLTSLTELDLSDNNISALPPELVLRLDGNPLRSIRRPILDRRTKAVLKYLKDKIPEQ
ncbi:hypothetical protein CRYUN_Cryun38cG0051700 [Craigia yunnanensis]